MTAALVGYQARLQHSGARRRLQALSPLSSLCRRGESESAAQRPAAPGFVGSCELGAAVSTACFARGLCSYTYIHTYIHTYTSMYVCTAGPAPGGHRAPGGDSAAPPRAGNEDGGRGGRGGISPGAQPPSPRGRCRRPPPRSRGAGAAARSRRPTATGRTRGRAGAAAAGSLRSRPLASPLGGPH